jgi:hypothetical protein
MNLGEICDCVLLGSYSCDSDVFEDNTETAAVWSVDREIIDLIRDQYEYSEGLIRSGSDHKPLSQPLSKARAYAPRDGLKDIEELKSQMQISISKRDLPRYISRTAKTAY